VISLVKSSIHGDIFDKKKINVDLHKMRSEVQGGVRNFMFGNSKLRIDCIIISKNKKCVDTSLCHWGSDRTLPV